MLNVPLPYRIIGFAVAALSIYLTGYHKGYSGEHGRFVAFQAQVTEQAKAQAAVIKEQDKTHQENANAAQQSSVAAINSIADYYRQHPVTRVQHDNTCAGSAGQATGNPAGADDTAADDDAASYESPYSPEDTEIVASRLYELQNLLRADGVTIR